MDRSFRKPGFQEVENLRRIATTLSDRARKNAISGLPLLKDIRDASDAMINAFSEGYIYDSALGQIEDLTSQEARDRGISAYHPHANAARTIACAWRGFCGILERYAVTQDFAVSRTDRLGGEIAIDLKQPLPDQDISAVADALIEKARGSLGITGRTLA